MKLGGPVFEPYGSPGEWVAALRRRGYGAAYCPLEASADDEAVLGYAHAAREAGIVIAEVGAWSNPLSPDPETRRKALEHCQRQLELAERIGARCCVNIAGSLGEQWDGPHPRNLSEDTFALVVDSVREILDAVKPSRTYYTLETMPWVHPESPADYLRLIRAVDRERFAAHLDPVNLVNSPRRFYNTGALLRECFELLGPFIRSCHAKDIALSGRLTVHLDEVRPGLGGLDYRTYLQCLSRLDPDTPLMLEHLPSAEEYDAAAAYLRGAAAKAGLDFR